MRSGWPFWPEAVCCEGASSRLDIFGNIACREYRLIARQLQKLTGIASGEKNRLHKLLTDAGIRLSVVVSDMYGKSAKAMITGLLDGETPEQLLAHADPRLKATPDDLREALSDSHRFVIRELMAHIDELQARIDRFRQTLLSPLRDYQVILQNLQTIPGIDELSAAMLLVEIGDDMSAFGSPR